MPTTTKTPAENEKPKQYTDPAHTHTHPQKPAAPTNTGLESVQRSAGNLAMQHLLNAGTIKAKLAISQPNDPDEIEADQIADRVMRMPDTVAKRSCPTCASSSTPCPTCSPNTSQQISRKAIGPTNHEHHTSAQQLMGRLGSGHPLDSSTRAFFEPRFGTDLSYTRIHTNSSAVESARALNARAYAFGPNIVFGKGEYNPESFDGKRLLAHELAHIFRQGEKIHRQIRTDEEPRLKGLLFDRLRAASPTSDAALRAEVESRFPAGTDDRWLAETIMRNGPEPLWPNTDLVERQRRAIINHWEPEPGNIEGILSWSLAETGGSTVRGTGPHTVQAFYFRGTSDRRALILGGVHGSEPGGVEVVNHLLTLLRAPDAPMPFFSLIVIPELFSGNLSDTRRRSSGTVMEMRGGAARTAPVPDPNRQFPALGSDPVFNSTLGCLVDSEQRCIEPENLILMDIINRFQPERVASVHGHSIPRSTRARPATSTRPAVPARTAEENLLLEGGPSITTDPRPGHEREDDALALAMAREAHRRGVRVPANFIGTPNERTRYPTSTAPRMSEGITFGGWGSHATPTRPAMNIVLIETFGNATSAAGSEAARTARRTELMNLAEILRDFFLVAS